jgi:DNA polymerase-3 subunit alpha
MPHIGVEVKPPDINSSGAGFTVVFDEDEPRDNLHGHIRFGLGAIKGIGRSAIGAIIEERDRGGPFASLFDFCERVPPRVANKGTLEALVKGGALDALHGKERRAAVCAAIEEAISAGHQAAEDRRSGQMSIFSAVAEQGPAETRDERPLPGVPAWDQMTMLAGEKETLGIHVSGHPLDQHEAELRQYCTTNTAEMQAAVQDAPVVIGGILSRVRITTVRSGRSAGQRMAMITIQDRAASIDGVVFSDVFARDAPVLQEGSIVLLVGTVDHSRGSGQLRVEQALRIEDAPRHLGRGLELSFMDEEGGEGIESQMNLAAGVLQQAGAARVVGEGRPVEVQLRVITAGKEIDLKAAHLRIVPEPALLQNLRDVLGEEHVRLITGGPPPRNNGGGSAPRWRR